MNTLVADIEITVIGPDQIIRVSIENATESTMTVKSTVTGQSRTAQMAVADAARIIFLYMAGDEDALSEAMYEHVEPILAGNGFDGDHRPIP